MNKIRRVSRFIMRSVCTCLSVIVGGLLFKLKRDWVVALLMQFVRLYIKFQSSADALRFLFALDERLYILHGQLSVAYGGGVHSKHRHMRYHDFFVDRISEGENVLDIGCGNGAVAFDVAQKAGGIVVGIDFSQANIAIAKEKYFHKNIEYFLGDALKDLPAKRFDVVILSNVLEHLPGRVNFLQRVVENTGTKRILLRIPLFERDWRVPLKKELGMEWRLDKTHHIEYTLEQFAAEMKMAEMEISHLEVRWGEIWAGVEPNES